MLKRVHHLVRLALATNPESPASAIRSPTSRLAIFYLEQARALAAEYQSSMLLYYLVLRIVNRGNLLPR